MPPRPKSKRTASLPAVVKDHKQVATRPVMLLVLGPHRSGTSLTARMLECLGAENSRHLNPPNFANPKGYFEDFDIYKFNDTVLLPCLGSDWSDILPVDWSNLSKAERSRLGLQALEILRRNYSLANPLSVLKEPRINNTLPFWLSLLEHMGFDVRIVCVIRDPVSAARSLTKRDKFSLAHGGMIYLTAWLSILSHLQERQVSFVQFDEIFAMPGKVLGKVADKLGLAVPGDFDQRVHEFTSEHLDASLRHSSLPREDVILEPDLPPLATELYRALLEAAQSQNIRKTAKFAAYAERHIESLAPLLADYNAKQTRLASLQVESEAATAECARLQSQLTDSSHESRTALISERDAVVAEREMLRSRISALEAEHSELASRHQPLATVLEDLQGQHSSLSALHSSLIAERDGLIAERDALVTEREAVQSAHSSLSTLHSSLIAERDELATRHSSLVTERDALHSDHSSLIAERDDLVTRHTSLVTALEELQGQHSSLSTTHSSLIAERDDLATRHQQLATALESLQSQHSTLIAERDALATRVTTLESELTDGSYELQTKLLAERNSLARAIKERDGAARERDQFAAKLIKLEREHHALAKSEHSRKVSHSKLEERFARASAALALLKNAQDEATSLRTALASLESAPSSLSTTHSSLLAEHSSLSTHHSSLSAERNELVTALEQLQGQHSSLMAQGNDHVAELKKASNRIRSLEENIQSRFEELAELTKRLIAAEDSQQQITAERDTLAARTSNLEAEHSELLTRHSALATALDDLHAQHSSLLTKHTSLVAEIDTLSARQTADSEVHQRKIRSQLEELALLSREAIELQKKLEKTLARSWDFGAMGDAVAATEISRIQNQPPHQHIEMNLTGVKRQGKDLGTLLFRIVNHHSRYGFCVFRPSSGQNPLEAWESNGQEDARPYMLVVPSNKSSRRLLRNLSAKDSSFLNLLLAAAERAMRCTLEAASAQNYTGRLEPWLEGVAELRRALAHG